MVAERIRNKTSLAMLCYAAMLWMDPAFRTNRHICLIYHPQLSNFPPPACAACPAWPMQTRCPIYYLSPSLPPSIPSLPIFIPFHSASPPVQPAKEHSNRVQAIGPSAIDRSLIPFLPYPHPEKTTRTRLGKKTWFVTRTFSLSLSLSPCVRPSV